MLGSYSSAGTGYGLGGDGINVGRYIQYWNNYTLTSTDNGATQFDQMGGTTGSSDAMGSMWAMFYYGQGQNLNKVVQWGVQQKKWDYVGVAMAIRAWGWYELVNNYNSLVLKEAFDVNRASFDYDDPAAVYDTLRANCYTALDLLNRTGDSVNPAKLALSDAYLNQGNKLRWKKFVYGILARSYYSLSNKSDYKPDSVIYYCNLSLATNDDNPTLKFAALKTSGSSSYFGPFRGNIGAIRQSAYVASLMSGGNSVIFKGVADPRTWYMLRENADSTFTGVVPGVEGSSSLSIASQQPQNFWGNAFNSTGAPAAEQGRYVYRDSGQFPIMTASEIQFMKSEAALRKGDAATALAAYVGGISLNFDMLASNYPYHVPASRVITPATKAAYLANPAIVPANASGLTLTHILMQKYIALYGWGFMETWTDMRRFHYTKDLDPATGQPVYPDFVPAGGKIYVNNNNKPVYRCRPRYNSEYIYDIPALQKIGGLNLDYHTNECWFSQK